ncbi:hypothetical protein BC835DRAFT_1264072 [Cytidiella melzeri]|nr:hypothetical protein BC835DRAFT_1264072 [Cytidiella melzeri]
MSLSLPSFDESPGWGASSADPEGDVVSAAIQKEKTIQYVSFIHPDNSCFYPTLRVKIVQRDVDKLASGNETLQMYIDNLTLQMAKRR